MNNRMRRSLLTVFTALAVLVGIAAVPATAPAQCIGFSVANFGCPVNLCLVDVTGATVFCQTVPHGFPPTVYALPAGFVIGGVLSAGGFTYMFPGQPPRPACAGCITLQSAAVPPLTCCGSVCYDDMRCLITITPCGPPCLP